MQTIPQRRAALAGTSISAVCLTLLLSGAAAADALFDVTEIPVDERVVAAVPADADGDGRPDLLVATLSGLPPNERRQLNVYRQTEAGALVLDSASRIDIPHHSAVFDVADIDTVAGDEILFLVPDGVTVVSLAGPTPETRQLEVDGPTTFSAAADERGFNRHRMVYNGFGDRPTLLVPQIGALSALAPDGQLLTQMQTARRANYVVARPASIVSFESDIQAFFDLPRLSVGDVNGDGLADVVTATRHEIRVFHQDQIEGLPEQASLVLPLGLVSSEDHWRGSGSVSTSARDVNADGRVDLVISHILGALTDTTSVTYLFLNRQGSWNLEAPDATLRTNRTLSSDVVTDINGDGRLELLRFKIKFSLLELVELLLQRKIDARVAVHRLSADDRYDEEPDAERKISVGFSFDTFRAKGFTPRGEVDLNGDGVLDFVTSADGDGIEVYLGEADGVFQRRALEQDLPSAGRIEFADLNGDALPDFVLYNQQLPGEPIRVGINRGVLPVD